MSLLLAIVFASAGFGDATQGADTCATTASILVSGNSSTTQGSDTNNGVLAAFGPVANSDVTQGADTGSGRGIPLAAPLGVGFSAVSGAQVETWTPVAGAADTIWNLGG